jgi:hypothetical protein
VESAYVGGMPQGADAVKHPPPPAQPAQQHPHPAPHRLSGRAAWRFVLTCALAGPLLGYGILAIALTLAQLPFDPTGAMAILLAALFGIVYFGVGLLMGYIAGLAPATVAGLFCLWWFNRFGTLSRTAAAGAGLLAGVASAAIVFTAVGGWRDFGYAFRQNFGLLAAVVATSILASLILAPVALRRARRE